MTGPDTPDLGARIARAVGVPAARVWPLGAQHRWRCCRAVLADGREVFAKVADAGLGGVFEAEARGLAWLGEARAVPVPSVLGQDEATLVVSWVPAGSPDAGSAERFGADLARTHGAGASRFGAPWPGFIASLPLPNGAGGADAGCGAGLPGGGPPDWPAWYAAQRIEPYLRRAADAGTLSRRDVALVEAVMERAADLAGPPEPPSRIHGDCWSGNVLWSGGRGWLIDPAAHGGHRETDLAMLALFGAPRLDRIISGYQEVAPLAPGWQGRVPLHQLHPLLVHVCLFGGAYRGAVVDAAARLLRS